MNPSSPPMRAVLNVWFFRVVFVLTLSSAFYILVVAIQGMAANSQPPTQRLPSTTRCAPRMGNPDQTTCYTPGARDPMTYFTPRPNGGMDVYTPRGRETRD